VGKVPGAKVTEAVNTEQKPPRPLSPKQRVFIEAYLETWNATEAARQAQYKDAMRSGWQLLKLSQVQAAIQARLEEVAMPANEVLTRLTQQARVNAGDFFKFKHVPVKDEKGQPIVDENTGEVVTKLVFDSIDWDMVRTHGYLIKKLGWARNGQPVLELHDSQKALELLGKHHRLFFDQVDMNVNGAIKAYVGISPDDWDEQ
jgi:phage terminase small subunit